MLITSPSIIIVVVYKYVWLNDVVLVTQLNVCENVVNNKMNVKQYLWTVIDSVKILIIPKSISVKYIKTCTEKKKKGRNMKVHVCIITKKYLPQYI